MAAPWPPHGLPIASRWPPHGPCFVSAALEHQETLGPDHPGTLISVNNLALSLQAQGQLEVRILHFSSMALDGTRWHLISLTLQAQNQLAVGYLAQQPHPVL